MPVNHDPQKKKTEEFVVKLPSANVSLSESQVLTVPRPDLQTQEKNSEAFHNYVYDNFSTWINGAVSRSSEEAQEYLAPVTDVVNRYLKTIDINKIDRDLTNYAESTLRSVKEVSLSLKENVDSFIVTQLNTIEKQPLDESVLGMAKKAVYSTAGYVGQGFDYIMPYVEALGTKILGEVSYNAVAEAIGSAYLRTIQLLKDFFKALTENINEEKTLYEIKINENTSTFETNLSMRDARETSECLDEISSFSKGFFNEKNEEFLARRITDVREDGIRQEQPDVIRRDLMEDLARDVFDPFPTYENREKDRQEVRDKSRLESLGRFARVGIDGELPAIDKLDLLTKTKVVG